MIEDAEHRLILVIDDDPFQLKVLTHMLSLQNIHKENVKTCLSGSEALTYLPLFPHHQLLIMLDLNMPEMDGVEVVRQLAERDYTGALVLVSGEDTRILETAVKLGRARSLNVLGHLDKPVQRDTLSILLDKWSTQQAVIPRTCGKQYSSADLQKALDHQELFNVYQPKVDVATGKLIGVETLVRWNHPEDGLVFPDSFIGIAEEHGLIDELTRYVLREALRQTKRWDDEGLALRVAVNVSMNNLTKIEFADFVLAEIAHSGICASQIILEVTESKLMRDNLAPLDILTRLRLKHISLSIDDFGTGHSSLAQLRDIPFDELKIDRSFVHGVAANATIRSIFEGSLSIARQLNMKVVAEGVEDIEDWAFLQEHDCDVAQGYFVAKPMSSEKLPGWLAEWETRFSALKPV